MTEQAAKLKVGLVSPYAWTSRWGVNRHIADSGQGARRTRATKSRVIAPSEERVEARTARKQSPRRPPHGQRVKRKLPGAGQTAAAPLPDRQRDGTRGPTG